MGGGDNKRVAHEMGHSLNLTHTFPDVAGTITSPNLNIPKESTKNFMDYGTFRNMFFYAQWLIAF